VRVTFFGVEIEDISLTYFICGFAKKNQRQERTLFLSFAKKICFLENLLFSDFKFSDSFRKRKRKKEKRKLRV